MTTHVLDTARGRPAAAVPVTLEHVGPEGSRRLGAAQTGKDGRVGAIGPDELEPGTYQLVFDTAAYAAGLGADAFFPAVTITFVITDGQAHHHVPLLLSPYGYTAYRGS